MNYIVLDMEWNQPYPGEKLVYRNNLCISNEIIQIGAVKMDEKCNIIDTFSINIKPVLFEKINKNVSKLTGINKEHLACSETLAPSIEKFKNWCGEDFVFITWGYDDISVLGNNLRYFSIDASWLPEFYNLQMIFCAQTDNENRQYSLSYAAEYFKITTDKPLHNALTDAYYTALVCSKLDINKGISKYNAMVFKDKSIPDHMKNIVYKRNHSAVEGYDNLIRKCGADDPVCYNCGDKLEITKKAKNGIFNRMYIGKCKIHGEFAGVFRINKCSDNTYNAVEQFFALDNYNKEYFVSKAKKMSDSDKTKKRAYKKKVKSDKTITASKNTTHKIT